MWTKAKNTREEKKTRQQQKIRCCLMCVIYACNNIIFYFICNSILFKKLVTSLVFLPSYKWNFIVVNTFARHSMLGSCASEKEKERSIPDFMKNNGNDAIAKTTTSIDSNSTTNALTGQRKKMYYLYGDGITMRNEKCMFNETSKCPTKGSMLCMIKSH